MAIQTTEDYVTVREAADILNVGTSTMRRWIREQRIPHYRLGQRRVLVRRAHLDQLVTLVPATPVTSEDDVDINDIERFRLTPKQRQERHAAIERIIRRRQEILDRRGGKPLSSSLELLHEARAQRSRELA
jgi:excisionase family DNA binding protein